MSENKIKSPKMRTRTNIRNESTPAVSTKKSILIKRKGIIVAVAALGSGSPLAADTTAKRSTESATRSNTSPLTTRIEGARRQVLIRIAKITINLLGTIEIGTKNLAKVLLSAKFTHIFRKDALK